MFKIKVTEEMGRGLYASRSIEVGEVVTQCELLVFNPDDTIIVNNETDLKYYTFRFNSQQDCLCLGDGEIFNHSDMPNVSYQLESFEDRQVMVFRALRRIETDVQLLINYAADIEVNAAEYVNHNMVG